MSVMIEKKDVLNIAVKIEENGERFYREAAKRSKSEEVKRLFEFLANDEVKHKETFSKMVRDFKVNDSEMTEEYQNYLKAYSDRLVFDDSGNEAVNEMKELDQVWAINFAIQRELDSVLYYYELKNIVAKSEHPLIDRIIDEERSHFTKLSKIKSILINR